MSVKLEVSILDLFFFRTECFANMHYDFFAYRENIGLLALTRVGSRRVVQISAGFMIFFSVLGILIDLIFQILLHNCHCISIPKFSCHVLFIWQTRKIWSSVRIDSTSHICRHVLSLLRICWYVHVPEITIIL